MAWFEFVHFQKRSPFTTFHTKALPHRNALFSHRHFFGGVWHFSHNFGTTWSIFKFKYILESPLVTLSNKTNSIKKLQELAEIQLFEKNS